MCNDFSAIVTTDRKVYFCETDSHEELIKRLGLSDDKLADRDWVRVECLPPYRDEVTVDEPGTVPGWYMAQRGVIERMVRSRAKKRAPAWAAYEAATAPAEAACEAARATAWAACEAARATAWAAYIKEISKIDGYVPMKEV